MQFHKTANNPIDYYFDPQSVVIADFNNDTWLDIVVANHMMNNIIIFFGNVNGIFLKQPPYSTGPNSTPKMVAVGDFNNDSRFDIAVANFGTNNVGIFLELGNGSFFYGYGNGRFSNPHTFTDPIVFSTGSRSRPISIAVGHFDDDTLLDIVVTNSRTNNLAVYLNNGNGTFATKTINLADTFSPYSVGVGDFNGDNRLDIVFTNIGIQNVGVYLGYGHGTFLISKMYSTGSGSSISLAVGDLNKDNRLDVVVISNDTGSIDILLGSFKGFSNQSIYSIGSWPISVAVGDFNNDTRLDIVVTNIGDFSVSVLLGCFTGHKSCELGGQRVFEINSRK
jgi:hypothetical protein